MATISLCMIVKNEEKVLGRCLNCIKDIADEIIIVDTGSTDNTREIAKEFTDKVFDFTWIDDFSAARNYSYSKATKDYILWLDADDVILPEDQIKFKELKQNLDSSIDMFMMKYNIAFDEYGNTTLSYYRERLAKRSNSYIWKEPVHEFLERWGKIVNADICITHKKENTSVPGRNLLIYEKVLASGKELSLRGIYYYARELYYSGNYELAIEYFNKFLVPDGGWVEDKIFACSSLSICYEKIKDKKNVLKPLLKSFEYDTPRAEVCCQIGDYYFNLCDYKKAIFWYKLATQLEKPVNCLGLVYHDCWGFFPNMQLCVCYDRLGNLGEANKYNEIAGKYKPYDACYQYNKNYFKKITKE